MESSIPLELSVLVKYVLGVFVPNAVVPTPIIVGYISLSIVSLDTLTYQFLFGISNWIGCPISPDLLSDTLLTTVNSPPVLLMVRAVPSNASFKVLATLRSFEFNPLTIAK